VQAYSASELVHPEPRRHPWTIGGSNESFRYYDFKRQPELVSKVLEDFVPNSHHLGMGQFFGFLRWINGPQSIFESNDCAAHPPKDNDDPTSVLPRAQVGRVMLLFRDIPRNLVLGEYDLLIPLLIQQLQCTDPAMTKHLGVFGLTKEPTGYELPGDTESVYLGIQLAVNFWVWGENDDALFENFGRMFSNLTLAMQAGFQNRDASPWPRGQPAHSAPSLSSWRGARAKSRAGLRAPRRGRSCGEI